MRILLKILFFPIVVVLTVFSMGMRIVLGLGSIVTNLISGGFILLAISCKILSCMPNTAALIDWNDFWYMFLFAFCFSPIGLMGIANWLIDRVDDFNGMLMSI